MIGTPLLCLFYGFYNDPGTTISFLFQLTFILLGWQMIMNVYRTIKILMED
jgi:hypothetical protein